MRGDVICTQTLNLHCRRKEHAREEAQLRFVGAVAGIYNHRRRMQFPGLLAAEVLVEAGCNKQLRRWIDDVWQIDTSFFCRLLTQRRRRAAGVARENAGIVAIEINLAPAFQSKVGTLWVAGENLVETGFRLIGCQIFRGIYNIVLVEAADRRFGTSLCRAVRRGLRGA